MITSVIIKIVHEKGISCIKYFKENKLIANKTIQIQICD